MSKSSVGWYNIVNKKELKSFSRPNVYKFCLSNSNWAHCGVVGQIEHNIIRNGDYFTEEGGLDWGWLVLKNKALNLYSLTSIHTYNICIQ